MSESCAARLPRTSRGPPDVSPGVRRSLRLSCLALLVSASACGSQPGQRPTAHRRAAPDAAEAPAKRLLARSPYLGVACPTANSIACDRVGLAVWLRRA